MNISNVEVTPCALMDAYDLALRNLHQEIMLQSITRERDQDAIAQLQGASLVIRNKIADLIAVGMHALAEFN